PQQVSIAGHNRDALPAPRSSHIEQLFSHPISGNDNRIDRLPLAAMGGDCVSVCELLVVLRQGATVLQMNTSLLINAGNRHQLSIGSAKARLAPICHEQQVVIGSNFDGAALVDFKAFRVLRCELTFFAACVTGNDLAVFHSDDFQRFMPSNALDRPMKFQHLAFCIVPHVTLLRARPVEWYVMLLVGALSQFPCARALSADSLGNMANLFVCGSDNQHTAWRALRIGLSMNL